MVQGRSRQSLPRIFHVPLLIGLLSGIGLVSALMGDDAWDVVSWLTLAVPIAMTFLSLVRARKPHRP